MRDYRKVRAFQLADEMAVVEDVHCAHQPLADLNGQTVKVLNGLLRTLRS